MFIIKEFNFDAAHNLIRYKGKCERLHGHTYKLVVIVEGSPDEEGMVIDFLELKKIVEENVLNFLDHSYINDIIKQPTAENIAIWVWNQLKDKLKRENCSLYEVQIWESPESGAIYREEKC
ncbi:MAG TPA: 6-carboxytetrahydropterin synthase QueD [Dictyoglomaceae bacterium]|nr:6-carboxytetrahydropterin synthase QueD [Dictyoglomaceae bacterium]HOL39880.1 6-carboxytetrahydropterin synthase QueD [Dictyoglomaceae bacterium]HOP95274.1 6-carboxytetrahydropterin synthase QueD [Dictyoglomaceae bacterium]HPP16296.1 6-carboxytetrahydropterin synthase QueD [Dictyoglomaceae bacterium]HPU43269.1 6-carboxytetrahydropterin synthase QueD [Dictyoglomaceae bacterium]